MQCLKSMILNFLTEIRTDNRFNNELWEQILSNVNCSIKLWKDSGAVPKDIVPYFLDLVSFLSGGSRFVDEDTLIKMEEADIRIREIFYDLCD